MLRLESFKSISLSVIHVKVRLCTYFCFCINELYYHSMQIFSSFSPRVLQITAYKLFNGLLMLNFV